MFNFTLHFLQLFPFFNDMGWGFSSSRQEHSVGGISSLMLGFIFTFACFSEACRWYHTCRIGLKISRINLETAKRHYELDGIDQEWILSGSCLI